MNGFKPLRLVGQTWRRGLLAVGPLLAALGCSDPGSTPIAEAVVQVKGAVADRVGVCNQDPRVTSGLVPLTVCAGARVFFDETFGGNGRTCGTCHPAQNNYTIDQPFIASLPATDPLFVAETQPATLGTLETPALRMVDALIKENVDGFSNQPGKFVSRAVSHTLSLATSIARDPADGTTATLPERVGWGGDGSPNGTLRSFIDGAIKQHYPQRLDRVVGTDFRLPTDAERDQVLAFQLALGRTQDINLASVTLTDAGAAAGKTAFMDPLAGRCNECHANAGANALASGKNRNFNTGTVTAPATPLVAIGTFADGSFLFDGGFGGQGLTNPNFDALPPTGADSFGDGTFNTPPLIEAADTGPFFHQHGFGQGAGDPTANIETAVAFYSTPLFLDSPAAKELNGRFGGVPVNVGPSIGVIGRLLRVLNASFNLAMAKQRLDGAHLLNVQYWGYRDDIQKGLLRLASKEIDDARRVLANGGADLHAAQQTSLADAQALLAQAIAATDPAIRKARTEAATTIVQNAKNAFGTNMNFQLGTGDLMF
jgi:cytochrome c peroxidase